MDKKTLRHIYLKKRMDLSFEQKNQMEQKIATLFETISFDFPMSFFLSYKSIEEKNEVAIFSIEKYLCASFLNIKKCYPVMDSNNNDLKIACVDEHTIFSKNYWKIEEPLNGIWINKKKLDIILTPLLIFDEKGFRVGYGKGMYDKLFGMCKKEVFKIGFCFFCPIEKIEDINPYDVSLDIVITPEKIFRFKV